MPSMARKMRSCFENLTILKHRHLCSDAVLSKPQLLGFSFQWQRALSLSNSLNGSKPVFVVSELQKSSFARLSLNLVRAEILCPYLWLWRLRSCLCDNSRHQLTFLQKMKAGRSLMFLSCWVGLIFVFDSNAWSPFLYCA